MSEQVEGKTPASYLDEVLTRLGTRREEVLIGPGIGIDAGIVALGEGKVLSASTDPMSYLPELGPVTSAALSVRSLFGDLAASGIWPKYALFSFNLPPKMRRREFLRYWKAVSEECRREGVAIIGGHTGSYPGSGYTVIGAGTVIGTGDAGSVFGRNPMEGDRIIMTKTAAIETTAVLSRLFPRLVSDNLGRVVLKKGQEYFRLLSVLNDAKVASSAAKSGIEITSVHDVAEGGVVKAAVELGRRCRRGVKIQREGIPVSDTTAKICELFNIDPIFTLGQGSLLITCKEGQEEGLAEILRKNGVPAANIGSIGGKNEESVLLKEESQQRIVDYVDPYWNVYEKMRTAEVNRSR